MNILVPIDGSKYSQAAVDFIASRSTLIGTDPHVELLNVQLPIPPHALRAVGKAAANEYQAMEAERVLKPAVDTLKKAGLEVTPLHAVGHPSEAIAARADQINADLVVIGSHGHGALSGLVLGSTVAGLLARTEHPVLVLRGAHAAPPDTMSVGIAVDGSKYGLAAAQYVIDHRQLLGAAPRITVLNVVPDLVGSMMPSMEGMALPVMSEEEIKAQQDKAFETAIAPVRAMLEKAGLKADDVCLVGNPGDELSEYASKRKLDLLVLGSHGYGAFKAAVLGSVATRVAAHCTTPLLLIRAV
jgi:nucleotide-binding universal stress UspA family protein